MKISKYNIRILLWFILCLALASLGLCGEQLEWQVISSGGGRSTSENFDLKCIIAQTAVGRGTSASYEIWHSLWQSNYSTNCCNLPGDANNDDQTNVGDAVYLINYVFSGGPPSPCMDEGDANSDCSVNIGDAVFLISYIFGGGPVPACGCAE